MFIMFNNVLNSETSVTDIVQNISIGKTPDECLSANFGLSRFGLLVFEYLKHAPAICITR